MTTDTSTDAGTRTELTTPVRPPALEALEGRTFLSFATPVDGAAAVAAGVPVSRATALTGRQPFASFGSERMGARAAKGAAHFEVSLSNGRAGREQSSPAAAGPARTLARAEHPDRGGAAGDAAVYAVRIGKFVDGGWASGGSSRTFSRHGGGPDDAAMGSGRKGAEYSRPVTGGAGFHLSFKKVAGPAGSLRHARHDDDRRAQGDVRGRADVADDAVAWSPHLLGNVTTTPVLVLPTPIGVVLIGPGHLVNLSGGPAVAPTPGGPVVQGPATAASGGGESKGTFPDESVTAVPVAAETRPAVASASSTAAAAQRVAEAAAGHSSAGGEASYVVPQPASAAAGAAARAGGALGAAAEGAAATLLGRVAGGGWSGGENVFSGAAIRSAVASAAGEIVAAAEGAVVSQAARVAQTVFGASVAAAAAGDLSGRAFRFEALGDPVTLVGDSLASFADESVALGSAAVTEAVGGADQTRIARAWAVTAAVVAIDVAVLVQWRRSKGKRARVRWINAELAAKPEFA